jgi:DNA-binding beta-propeller fold protein YncE
MIDVGDGLWDIDVNPETNRVYVNNECSGTVSVIATLSNQKHP